MSAREDRSRRVQQPQKTIQSQCLSRRDYARFICLVLCYELQYNMYKIIKHIYNTCMAPRHSAFVLALNGATENARHENAVQRKMQGWKMQEWNMRHKTAGLENARQVSMESEQMLFI